MTLITTLDGFSNETSFSVSEYKEKYIVIKAVFHYRYKVAISSPFSNAVLVN